MYLIQKLVKSLNLKLTLQFAPPFFENYLSFWRHRFSCQIAMCSFGSSLRSTIFLVRSQWAVLDSVSLFSLNIHFSFVHKTVTIFLNIPLRRPKVSILMWQVPEKVIWQVLKNLPDYCGTCQTREEPVRFIWLGEPVRPKVSILMWQVPEKVIWQVLKNLPDYCGTCQIYLVKRTCQIKSVDFDVAGFREGNLASFEEPARNLRNLSDLFG